MSSASYYQSGTDRSYAVQRLFSRIAKRYDVINDLQSLGFHRVWKRRMLERMKPEPHSKALDLACGSGDLVFRLIAMEPRAKVFGGDYTLPMIRVGQQRAAGQGGGPIPWIQLDGLELPFQKEVFQTVTMAYGLRNMSDPLQCLREISRVMQSGGRLALLDFGKPQNPLIRRAYYFFLRTLQPALGWVFFRDAGTYRYIYESLMKYPAQEGVSRLLEESGFGEIECVNLCFGTMSLHFASKK